MYNACPKLIFNKTGIVKYFKTLINAAGGDGNGLYTMNHGNGTLEKDLFKIPNPPVGRFLFHTRRATHGEINEVNTQPFVGERYVLAHNGVFSEIDPYASLLGLRNGERFSDSWKMHYVIEKSGIENFVEAFEGDSFGVVLVYDKETMKMHLLKSTGTFEMAKIQGCNVYASQSIDFWEIDSGTKKSIGDGWFILGETQIQKVKDFEKKYTHWYGYKTYGSKTYGSKTDGSKTYTKKSKIYSCEDCMYWFEGYCAYANVYTEKNDSCKDFLSAEEDEEDEEEKCENCSHFIPYHSESFGGKCDIGSYVLKNDSCKKFKSIEETPSIIQLFSTEKCANCTYFEPYEKTKGMESWGYCDQYNEARAEYENCEYFTKKLPSKTCQMCYWFDIRDVGEVCTKDRNVIWGIDNIVCKDFKQRRCEDCSHYIPDKEKMGVCDVVNGLYDYNFYCDDWERGA